MKLSPPALHVSVAAAIALAATGIVLASLPSMSAADDATSSPGPSASPTGTPDPSAQPPAAIMPTKATLAQVLALYRASDGKPIKPISVSREVDAISGPSDSGTETIVRSGDDFVATVRLGRTSASFGSYRGVRWRHNENGYTRTVSGVHEESKLSARALADALKGAAPDSVRLLGEVAKPVEAYVIEVHPRGGLLEWLFIDKVSGRLVREEDSGDGVRETYTYDDFRTTDGVVTAWHETYADGSPEDAFDWKTTSLDDAGRVAPGELAIPPSRGPFGFPAGVTDVRLPVMFEDGAIIVHVTIGGRGLDLQLDSGSSGIVIDADVASQLGLEKFDTQRDSQSTSHEVSSAIVSDIDVGQLSMRNVVVECLPFYFNPDAEHKVVGLLGYDFFAGAVVKVDYVNDTVDAFDAASFKAPAGALEKLPIKLDDQVPMVDAQLGSGDPGNFIVDTGAQSFIIFDDFARAHSNDIARIGYADGRRVYYPKELAEGVGGYFYLQPVQARTFFLGNEGFEDVRLAQAANFAGEDIDGLVGYPILQFFDVYFDYADSTIMLQPNSVMTNAMKQ